MEAVVIRAILVITIMEGKGVMLAVVKCSNEDTGYNSNDSSS